MRRTGYLLLFATALTFAQQPPPKAAQLPPVPQPTTVEKARTVPLSHTDLYCAGYIADKPLAKDNFVAGGLETPQTSRFEQDDYIYLRGNYQPGTRVSLVRPLKDPNNFQMFRGQYKAIKKVGQPFAELGYAVIVHNRGENISVAKFEFACEPAVPGDLVVPFAEKIPFRVREYSTIDRFPSATGSITGRILLARDFDQYPGTGSKVYFNIGTDKGVKRGQYYRIVRGYKKSELDSTDRDVLNAPYFEDTQKDPPKVTKKVLASLPKRVVGEAVVLAAGPKSATAMITAVLGEVQVGDAVELEEVQPENQ